MTAEDRIANLRAALALYENWFAEHPDNDVPLDVALVATRTLAEDDELMMASNYWASIAPLWGNHATH